MTHVKEDRKEKKGTAHKEKHEQAHKVSYVGVDSLKPYKNNAKKHPKAQVQQIAASIKQFGFINPVLIDNQLEVIAGHGRLEAAKLLGLSKVPVIYIRHLSEAEVRAYRLADNQLTLNTGYDDALLRIEISELASLDINFDLELTGFETATLDIILGDSFVEEADPADDIPAIGENALPVTKLGDIWHLGEHRLICGNALHIEDYKVLLQNDIVDMVFTDPPYNVPVDGHVCGNGKFKHDEFAMASGEMSEQEFITFLKSFMEISVQFSRDGSLHYICMDWRHIFELISAGRTVYDELKNICVWNKTNGGMGSFYRSKHELVTVFKHGKQPHLNTIQLGKHGRYRTNVWDYQGANGFANQSDLAMHPTVKPVAMVTDAIKDCTRRGQIVLDPFAGSGSTLIACEKANRKARCIELEPKYCDVIIKRWQKITGNNAVHQKTGNEFNQLQEEVIGVEG